MLYPTLQPHELQHARLPCPSPSPGICSNSCPLMPSDHLVLCHPTISSSVVPFSSCPQSFPASGSFPMSQLFTSGGQRTGVAASVLPVNIQGWFPLRLTGVTSLLRQLVSPKSHWIRTDTWLPLPALPSSPRASAWLPHPPPPEPFLPVCKRKATTTKSWSSLADNHKSKQMPRVSYYFKNHMGEGWIFLKEIHLCSPIHI